MKLNALVALVVSFNYITIGALLAQEPQMFRYQGRILDNDALVSGNLDFSFKLYDSPTGGSPLYEDTATIMVVDGLYSTMIGDDTTSGGDLGDALNNPAVYLEITVGGETLTPRERIVSVPYAMNGLPSGSVVLSASNPNVALEAKGYSLVYSDVTSPEDWVVALEDELVTPFSGSAYQMEMVTFGSYVGFYNEGASSTEWSNPFYYSQDGIFWNESELPFYFGMYGENVELNAKLYVVSPNGAADGGAPLRVATTSNGADWTELSVSLPVSTLDSDYELEVFADQIWLFGSSSVSGAFVLKSSDGATWTAVDCPSWDTNTLETESTPTRLVVLASLSGGTGIYVWSTTDGASWTQSSEVIPSANSSYGAEMPYANGALWTFATPEGETLQALYKSTDWGNSWSQVSTNLPSNQSYDYSYLKSLAPSPGLFCVFDYNAYISEDGSDWNKVSVTNYSYSDVSSTGKLWVTRDVNAGVDTVLYSIGGPLRNGRFFYYQKD